MFVRLTLKTAAALAAAGALLVPTAASAQAYSYQGAQNYGSGAYSQRYDYDQSRYGYQDDRYSDYRNSDYDCRSDRSNRQGTGVALGATLGAVAGSQLAARGRRTEGSILGGVLGAVVGAGVGGSSARDCGDYARYDYRYDQSRYGDGYQSYDRGYDRNDYDRYDRYGRSYQDRYQSGSSSSYGYQSGYQTGCRTVAVRSRTYDGRYVTRYEQSCPDRY